MSVAFELVKDFWDYVEYYPDEDEPDFDGIHYGGIKGLSTKAPESAQKAYERYLEMVKKAEKEGCAL